MTVMPAVAEVDYQSNRQPAEEANPILPTEGNHHRAAENNSQRRNQIQKRRPEGTLDLGIRESHDPDGRAHDDEREERSDADHVTERFEWEQRRGNTGSNPG